MAQVTKSELNQQTARVLARVAGGRVQLPTASGPLTHPARKSDRTSAQILGDVRADRL